MAYKYPRLVGCIVVAGFVAILASGPNNSIPLKTLLKDEPKTVTAPKAETIRNLDLMLKSNVPIEPEAKIDEQFQDAKFLKAVHSLVLLKKFRCDSISAANEYIFSSKDGLTLICNRFKYSYSITDYGGKWKVELN